jgi:hypothetical protein
VLAWYVLFLGASIASAAVGGPAFQEVCSAGGVVKWVPDQGDAHSNVHTGMHCPLCGNLAAPPPLPDVFPASQRALSHVMASVAAAHSTASAAAPLPARGPPAVF